jgi:hypothetical protein
MTSELGAEARALITQACSDEAAPSSSELERIRKNVIAGAAASAALLAAPHAAGAGALATPLALVGLALKGAALGTIVALGGFSLDRFVLHPAPERASKSAQVRAPAEARAPLGSLATPSGRELSPPAPEPRAIDPQLAPPAVPLRPTAPKPGLPHGVSKETAGVATGSLEISADLREESALLARVQQELRAGRGADALRLLDASSPRLERGQLRQERLAAEVLAACQTGDVERARRGVRAFLAENPATPSAARLRSSCVGAEFFSK